MLWKVFSLVHRPIKFCISFVCGSYAFYVQNPKKLLGIINIHKSLPKSLTLTLKDRPVRSMILNKMVIISNFYWDHLQSQGEMLYYVRNAICNFFFRQKIFEGLFHVQKLTFSVKKIGNICLEIPFCSRCRRPAISQENCSARIFSAAVNRTIAHKKMVILNGKWFWCHFPENPNLMNCEVVEPVQNDPPPPLVKGNEGAILSRSKWIDEVSQSRKLRQTAQGMINKINFAGKISFFCALQLCKQ